MAIYYVDLENGNDSNDGLSFANRKKSMNNASTGGGDEIRVAGQAPVIVDNSAKIWAWTGDNARQQRSVGTTTYSETIGETSINYSGHGMQTGDTIGIEQNTAYSNPQDCINGVWEVTRVDDNNFKLQGYTGPSGSNGQTSSGGRFRYLKCQTIYLSSPVTQTIASTSQRDPWTASTNATATLQTFTGTWSSGCTWKTHYYSDKITIDSSFTTGKVAYYATGTLDLSGYQQISFYSGQRSGTRSQPATPHLSLRLCTDTTGDTSVHTIPVYSGPDSQTSQGFYQKRAYDFGTNLNSSIKSIALYQDTAVSSAQEWHFDNIIACKARSSADSLTLDSMVGLGTQGNCPFYYPIKSIVGNRVLLDTQNRSNLYYPYSYYTPGGVHWEGIGVARTTQSQTQKIYKLDPLRIYEDLNVLPQSGNNAFTTSTYLAKSGINTTTRLTVSGGWDTSTSMASRHTNGYTAVSVPNARGYPFQFSSCSYADISGFVGMGGYRAVYVNSCNYSSFKDIGGVDAYNGMYFQSNYPMNGLNIWGIGGYYALEFQSKYANYRDTGITTIRGVNGNYVSVHLNYCNDNSHVNNVHAYNSISGPLSWFYYSNGMQVDNIEALDHPDGGDDQCFRFYESSNCVVGVMTVRNGGYGSDHYQSRDCVMNYFYDRSNEEDNTRANGGNGNTNQNQSMYLNNGSSCKILQGGQFFKQLYIYQNSKIYTNNVVDLYSGNPSFSSGGFYYAKNYGGGNSGVTKNTFQYGTIEPESSIRHTASGVSWKIDISNSNATTSSPLEWLLTKLVVNANAAVTAKIWVYRDGTGVNGGIRIKGGSIGGVSSQIDAVISDSTINSWVECSLTFTPTEAGAVDIYAMGYYINSASHNVYLDDFSATQA